MKTKTILSAAVIGLAMLSAPLLAQSEGGNTGPQSAGGTSGNTGTATSGAGTGARGTNGGQSTTGGSAAAPADTNAPSGEYHPPPTASHPDQQR